MRSQITFAIGKVTRRNETNEAIAANERTATLKIGGSESGCSEATNEIGCNDTLQENIKLAPNMGTKFFIYKSLRDSECSVLAATSKTLRS